MSNPMISATRLQTLQHCSLRYYYGEILLIPETKHPKTRVGSAIHTILQSLMHPRRIAIFHQILKDGFKLADYPSIVRYINNYYRKYLLTYDPVEAEDMINVAFTGLRIYFEQDPPESYFSERKFKLDLDGKGTITGTIDVLLLWKDKAVCLDFKTKGQKFSKAELPSNLQAAVYQLAVWREFGLIPTFDFLMLRHPPTSRTPEKFLQRVRPPSEAILRGLMIYLRDMYRQVNNFGLEEAYSSPTPDIFFCQRVCSFLRPFDYWAIVKKTDDPIKPSLRTFLLDQKPEKWDNDETLVRKSFKGCDLRYQPAS